MKGYLTILTVVSVLFLHSGLWAHPTGNLTVVGDHVLWSYVNPINDKEHHACVMIWTDGVEPRPLITSEFPASDFMIYAKDETIYLIERRFVQEGDTFETRVLKVSLDGETTEIWPWFEDRWRIGEGGFFMPSDLEIVFCRYPGMFIVKKGETPIPYFNFDHEIKRTRFLGSGNLLLLSDDKCWLTDTKGNILKAWGDLTEEMTSEPALGRNQVFDVDYYNGQLLVAYWGKRCFYVIDEAGNKNIIDQLEAPFTPHWVAFNNDKKLTFASKLEFNGSNPKPRLVSFDKGLRTDIWIRE